TNARCHTQGVNATFERLISTLRPKSDALLAMVPVKVDALPRGPSVPRGGVYLFSEGESHLYVGRTRRLRARLRDHCNPKLLAAPFAFRLARETVGMLKPSYTPDGSRRALVTDPTFSAAFQAAAQRIRE